MTGKWSEKILLRSCTCYQNHSRKLKDNKMTTADIAYDIIGLCFAAETKLFTTGSLFSHEKYKLMKICQKKTHTF